PSRRTRPARPTTIPMASRVVAVGPCPAIPSPLRTPLAGLTRAGGTLERGQELLGVLGPAERLTALVPPVAEATDDRDQLLPAGGVAAAQRLAFDDGEEHLDQVQPGGIRRGEVQPDPRMGGQPCLHPLVLVGGVVVQQHMPLRSGENT